MNSMIRRWLFEATNKVKARETRNSRDSSCAHMFVDVCESDSVVGHCLTSHCLTNHCLTSQVFSWDDDASVTAWITQQLTEVCTCVFVSVSVSLCVSDCLCLSLCVCV
jgi:hypothetical protein